MTPLALAVSRALIHFVWQGSIIWFALWCALSLSKQRSANSRYVAGCVALAMLTLAPVMTTWMLYARPAASISMSGGIDARALVPNVSAFVSQASRPLDWLQFWALPAWSLGVLVFSARLFLGCKHVFQLRRRGKPATDAIQGIVTRLTRSMSVRPRIRVLISAMTDTPSVVGWLRPAILLPSAAMMGLTPLQLEAIIAHEIGHIKRYDYLVNLFQMAIETVLFYHPAVWWTSKRIRVERELCCDDLAVRHSGSALRYARALTTLEKIRVSSPAIAMASTGGPLMYRIQRLVGVTAKEYRISRMPAAIAIGLGVLCLALNTNWVRGQDAPGVKVDLGGSQVLHRPVVAYPEQALKQGITGTVQLEAKLDSAGNVADARVLSGPEELRKTALESVLKWHFTSDAARGTRQITITFSEEGRQVRVREGAEPRVTTEPFLAQVGPAGEAKLEALSVAVASSPVVTRRQELEREIGALRAAAAKAAESQSRVDLENRIAELRKVLDATPFEQPTRAVARSVMNSRVQRITVEQIPDIARADLISKLPIREGDMLSIPGLEQTQQVLRSFDEHLTLRLQPVDENSVEIRIVPRDR